MAKGQRNTSKGQDVAGAERELKFEVPAAAWDGLRKEMKAAGAQAADLHAIYHDTADGLLARAKLSLRLRREHGHWVQTLKAPGGQVFERVEDEVPLGPVRRGKPPVLDPGRHTPRAAREALRQALGLDQDAAWPALPPAFEVKVRRHAVRVHAGRSVVELALDEGQVLAAGCSRPIRELELELVEGSMQDLLVLARQWRSRGRLCLSTASKAARGHLLVAGELYGPAVGASAPRLPDKPGMGEFAAAVLDACMDQVVGNAGEIAAGSQSEEHVHQLRVGIRRLRTALRELPGFAGERARREPILLEVFRALGERRDRSHVLQAVAPLVEAAGGKPLRIPRAFQEGADPADLVRADAFQDAVLGLILRAQQERSAAGGRVRKTVRSHLRELHEQVTQDGKRFPKLDQDRQHRVRKRLKRLRYLGEFAAPLYPAGAVRRSMARIKPAQDALGQFNDEIMAQGLFEELAQSDPDALFAVHWLQERRPAQAKACRKTLQRLAAARPFWEKA